MRVFDSQLYPFKMCISIGDDISEVEKKFLTINGSKISLEIEEYDALFVYDIIWATNKHRCFLIIARDFDLPRIVHEISHAQRRIWESIGELNPGEEANAYLGEWIMECCVQTNKDNEKKKLNRVNEE